MSPRRLGPASLIRLLGAWRGERAGPAYRQLAEALRLLILDGRLPLDVVLPGERELALILEIGIRGANEDLVAFVHRSLVCLTLQIRSGQSSQHKTEPLLPSSVSGC